MSLLELIRLAGKQALVTGAGRGIGKGCAVELASAGADVILNDRPGSEDIQQTAAEIRASGRTCPGRKDGTITEQVAHSLSRYIGSASITSICTPEERSCAF